MGRFISRTPNADGYLRVSLRNEKRSISVFVHVLVLEAFGVPRPSPLHHVNHVDGVKTNNRVENLEWATAAENIRHAADIGLLPSRAGELNGRAKLTENDVRAIRGSTESASKTAMRYGVAKSLILMIRRRELWKSVA